MRRIETVCLHTWFVWKMTNRNRTGDDALTESPSSDEGNRVLMEWSYQGIPQKAAAGRTVLLDEMFKPSKIGKLLCLGPVRWPPASLACTRLYAVHDARCCARGARFVHDIMFFSVRRVHGLYGTFSVCQTVDRVAQRRKRGLQVQTNSGEVNWPKNLTRIEGCSRLVAMTKPTAIDCPNASCSAQVH